MSLDERLQKYTDQLERGASLDEVISAIYRYEIEDQDELVELVMLASAVQSMPSPEIDPVFKESMDSWIGTAISKVPAKRTTRFSLALPGFLKQPTFAMSMGLLLVLAITLGSLFYLSGPRNAQAAVIMEVSGLVEAAPPSGEVWRTLSSGDTVRDDQIIKTDAASEATLVFYDGSRVNIEPNSEILIENISGRWGGGINVHIQQNQGKTTHSVVPLRGAGSKYLIDTPGASASVRGTLFAVGVDPDGKSRFTVRLGEVDIRKGKNEIALEAGQTLVTAPSGQELDSPAYTFQLQGKFEQSSVADAIIAGQKVNFFADTTQTGSPEVGDYVTVEGRILEDGEWVADEVETSYVDDTQLVFTGKVMAIGDDQWQIGDKTIWVDENTMLGKGLKLGSVAEVSFLFQGDGQQLALEITPIHTEPDPEGRPDVEFVPDEAEVAGCGPTLSASGLLVNAANNPVDAATDVQIGYSVERGAKYIQSIQVTPLAFSTLEPGDMEALNITVKFIEGASTAGENIQVKVRLFVNYETNQPKPEQSRMTATFNLQCAPGELPEETQEPESLVVTPEPGVSPVITDTVPVSTTYCTGANPQPAAEKLAETYGATYDEIMTRFCKGYGFGEIDLAYSLNDQYGGGVEAIFDLRDSGMSWGAIKQQLEGKYPPGKPDKEPKETKEPKP